MSTISKFLEWFRYTPESWQFAPKNGALERRFLQDIIIFRCHSSFWEGKFIMLTFWFNNDHIRNTPCQQAGNGDFGHVLKSLTKILVVIEATPLNKNVNMVHLPQIRVSKINNFGSLLFASLIRHQATVTIGQNIGAFETAPVFPVTRESCNMWAVKTKPSTKRVLTNSLEESHTWHLLVEVAFDNPCHLAAYQLYALRIQIHRHDTTAKKDTNKARHHRVRYGFALWIQQQV